MTGEIEIQRQAAPAIHRRRTPRRKSNSASVPYAGATSGERARAEATKILQRLGCEQVGFMQDFQSHELLLQFTHRGRPVQFRASANGWATLYLKKHPWHWSRRSQRIEYERAALRQGLIAVSSILRDWVKGQVMAIETGVLSFEAAFLPWMLTHDGRPMIEHVQDLLPAPADQKAVALPSPAAWENRVEEER
jgi:hypothetical protein